MLVARSHGAWVGCGGGGGGTSCLSLSFSLAFDRPLVHSVFCFASVGESLLVGNAAIAASQVSVLLAKAPTI